MQRINDILNDVEYLNYVNKIEKMEADRVYCRHDMTHFLDVSRISYILSLEQKLNINKEILYAMGILHDIGRWMEYESGIDHSIASKEIAERILTRYDFTLDERTKMIMAIEGHRERDTSSPLADILYRADKMSRNCVLCNAKVTCKNFQNGEESFLLY